MKKFICVFICLILFQTSCFAFNDINDEDLNAAIDNLVSFGIINGYEDDTFKPDNNITRAEFSKMVVCATGYNYFVCEIDNSFADVDSSYWGKDYIYIAKKLGIVNGTSDTAFEPETNVTYEQAIKMVVCALGYGETAMEKGEYPIGYIQVAEELGILNGIDFVQTDFATRKNIALIIDKALDVQYNEMYEYDNEIIVEKASITLREMHNMRLSNNFIEDEDYGNVDSDEENAVG